DRRRAVPAPSLRLASRPPLPVLASFFLHDTPPAALYPLSLHDALPISPGLQSATGQTCPGAGAIRPGSEDVSTTYAPASCSTSSDRKSTRLNSSHVKISYAVFCLKKKNHTIPSRAQPRRQAMPAPRGGR